MVGEREDNKPAFLVPFHECLSLAFSGACISAHTCAHTHTNAHMTLAHTHTQHLQLDDEFRAV